jgi:hypothetical protein
MSSYPEQENTICDLLVTFMISDVHRNIFLKVLAIFCANGMKN